jgi:hypothetical protein
MKKICFSFFLLSITYLATNAQVSFQFQPEVYGRNVDGLSRFKLLNLSSQKISGSVVIRIKEITNNQNIVDVIMPVTEFASGVNTVPEGIFRKSSFNFYTNKWAQIVNQTRSFLPGNYSFCFQFISSKTNDSYEDCFDLAVEPLLPLTLQSPSDRDTICNKRPFLSWQPPMPYHASMRFRLLLTEKKGAAVESVLKNAPLLLLDNISQSNINYPSSHPELKEGHTYVWQVVAYQYGVLISTSEVWEFTVQCKETEKPAPKDSYRELKSMVSGNYYIANRFLRFAFLNQYDLKKLNYTIVAIDKAGEPVKHLPEVALQQGQNKIDIDLTELNLEVGKQYLLRVFPFNESMVEIKFVYEDKDDLF